MAGKSVVQERVSSLSLMQQTVLLTAIRGADTLPKRHVSKYILRWLRRCVLISAFDKCVLMNPVDERGGNFTGPFPSGKSFDDLTSDYLNDVDSVPHHFHMHLTHAAEILGYKHPEPLIRNGWNIFYIKAVRDAHLRPES